MIDTVEIPFVEPPSGRSSGITSYADVDVPFTDEDLDRFENEPGGRTLD